MLQSTANHPPIQRRITLIRHAKAEEGDGADIARRLNARGEGDAAKLGQWLQAEGAFPQVSERYLVFIKGFINNQRLIKFKRI